MKVSALLLLARHHWDNVYGPDELKRLQAHVKEPLAFYTDKSIQKHPEILSKAEVIFSSWGMSVCDEAFLAAAPNLKAIFHAAGSIRPFMTSALWDRNITVTSSNSVLAISVAEFALAQILLSLKLTWRHARDMRSERQPVHHTVPGIFDSVVGLVSVGAVARHLISLLKPFRLRIVAFDPFLPPDQAKALGIELVSLDQLFGISHVVSLHTPALPETEGMIRGRHFARMMENATFINTARGSVVNEREMIDILSRRSDLQAILDVTHPEPPSPDSLLFSLPNVILTPHIAGPLDRECRRLGAMAVDEFERYRAGAPLQGEITKEMMETIA